MTINKNLTTIGYPVSYCVSKIGGKWKPIIIHLVRNDCNRFSKLQKAIPDISKQMLVNQLRELEEDKIIDRIIYPEIPPRVEYKITALGKTLFPVIDAMNDWGLKQMKSTHKSQTKKQD